MLAAAREKLKNAPEMKPASMPWRWHVIRGSMLEGKKHKVIRKCIKAKKTRHISGLVNCVKNIE